MKYAILFAPLAAILPLHASADDFDDVARVTRVTPQVRQINNPRRECWTEYVPNNSRRSDNRGMAGSVIGGLAGAILGNQVGGGNGRTAATAAGAVAGAIVGDRVQNDSGSEGSDREVRHCRQVDNWETRNDGYLVNYNYAGHSYSTVLPYDPGKTMHVRVDVTPRDR